MKKYKISVIGEAVARYDDNKRVPSFMLEECHGLNIQDEFTEYMWKSDGPKDVLESGYTHFEYKDDKLYAVCEYIATRELTDEELLKLVSYTQGQWSDGIGEGYEQEPALTLGQRDIFISPWHRGQKCVTRVTQIEE